MTAPVTLNGLRTQWHEWGAPDGRPLLCLHPLGQNGHFFDGLARALGTGWRIVSYDQRGHGSAADQPVASFGQLADDAAAALDRMGGHAHVAGFSMGGSVAAELAARRCADIPTLTLAATPHAGVPVFEERACSVRKGSIAAIAEGTVLRWFGRTTGDPSIDTARKALDRLTPESFDAAWRAFATFEGYETIAGSLPPALCLAFLDDLSTPPPILDRIAGMIRDAGGKVQRADIANAGHMGLLQKPRDVALEIERFVANCELEKSE